MYWEEGMMKKQLPMFVTEFYFLNHGKKYIHIYHKIFILTILSAQFSAVNTFTIKMLCNHPKQKFCMGQKVIPHSSPLSAPAPGKL